jgi:hypothetical protein
LLPWYVNQTLDTEERQRVERWLRIHPAAGRRVNVWQQVRAAAQSEPRPELPSRLRRQILAQLQAAPRATPQTRWLPWLSGAALALLALIVLWNVIQPGIGLQWSVNGATPAAFRIFRAPLGSDRFELVGEVRARSGEQDYTYVDTAQWLGQTYQYRVETVNRAAVSDTIPVSGWDLLPTQLAIVLSSILLGAAAAYMLQQRSQSIGLDQGCAASP